MNNILLGVALTTSAIGFGVIFYIKILKKKIKKYVLRNEKIKKYFRET